jgi:hypothetical protein
MPKVSSMLEGSPFSPRHIRMLKISIAVMTALIVLGVLALIYGMARTASRAGNQSKILQDLSKPYERTLDLGQSALASVSANNDYLILHLKSAGGDMVVVIDPKDGHEVGRIQVRGR